MKKTPTASFWLIAFTHFVPCFFIGVFLLYVLSGILPKETVTALAQGMFGKEDILIGICNGLLTGGIVFLFHINRNRRIKRRHKQSSHPFQPTEILYATILGFIGGALDVLLLLHAEGVILVTIVVIFILAWHLKIFNHHIIKMLKPGNIATWGDVSELMRIYMTMLAGFTLLNATLEGAHLLLGSRPPFGFMMDGGDIFLNSLYYTVVTMTTLGFGDFVPSTWDGKLMLIVQCLVSYVMFALMVGIITRGVVQVQDSQKT
ncbi:hypothetical protein GO013_09670 [Pseudodesulfovibrio sp. JC047]|uniref:ion channel n=1 Tax=Pseudodesulfovibrio sp. JC047 TaxID=2683199 RepID=UPI0013D7160F|nr:hypothetical protein [Pseudodesulfovibrio sp. JC047]